jgi:hypothetical protein
MSHWTFAPLSNLPIFGFANVTSLNLENPHFANVTWIFSCILSLHLLSYIVYSFRCTFTSLKSCKYDASHRNFVILLGKIK